MTYRERRALTAGGIVIVRSGAEPQQARVIFAEKPDRSIINALKQAGFFWSSGSWYGPR
jgi:hypothetical protein